MNFKKMFLSWPIYLNISFCLQLSIVSFLLSLSSSSSDPAIPYFPMETIVLAIRTVVDGYLEMYITFLLVSVFHLMCINLCIHIYIFLCVIKCRDDHTNGEVVDKIHIFRPDRVFKVTIFFPWIGTPFFYGFFCSLVFLFVPLIPFASHLLRLITVMIVQFLLEIHYQIESAVHPRHRCHRLSAIEALINIIGCRAVVPSTSW